MAKDSLENPARRLQLSLSPYDGPIDPSNLLRLDQSGPIDRVSLADFLRNGFIYPPYTAFSDTRVATVGFDNAADLFDSPQFAFPFHPEGEVESCSSTSALVDRYHSLLKESVGRLTQEMKSPWLLQSGGKDSTSLAIATADTRPDTVCLTYLGGREENEIESARRVARTLGLRHECLVCDPGRAYDRYLSIADRLPLLTGDFATLSYVDLAQTVKANGGDGLLDGLGSDAYFGLPIRVQHRLLALLARGLRLPEATFNLPLVETSFRLAYGLTSLQMNGFERLFPGTRFLDAEVDRLLGTSLSSQSLARTISFQKALQGWSSLFGKKQIASAIAAGGAYMAKGIYVSAAHALRIAYPYCSRALVSFVLNEVPDSLRLDRSTGTSKILVREHISRRFSELPYVRAKGSFRFDLVGLATTRFDKVYSLARQCSDFIPGAPSWLLANRHRLSNKAFASKFYLLALLLPWLHGKSRARTRLGTLQA
jgi:hypothetical protein